MSDLVDQIKDEINAVSVNNDEGLLALASELAVGVTAEREMEIVESLPKSYVMRESATADLGVDEIDVPRMVLVVATKVPDGEWITSTYGRRMRKEKANCVIGEYTIADNSYATIKRFAVLWNRVK